MVKSDNEKSEDDLSHELSEKEIRIQGKYIFSAAFLFVRTTINRLTAKKKLFLRKEIINQNFKEYAHEVFSAEKSHSFDSGEWKKALEQTLLYANRIAKATQKK